MSKPQRSNLPWLLGVAVVLLLVGAFVLFRGKEDEPSDRTPPPRQGAPDFGGLPQENVIKPGMGGPSR